MEKLSVDSVKPSAQTQWDNVGAISGLGVFFLGIVLLLTVFYLAFQQFSDITGSSSVQLNPEAGQINIQSDLLAIVTKVVFLFVMGYCGSWIMARGVQMYRASKDTRYKE